MPASSLTTSSPRVSERRVKHLRLFGSRLTSDCIAGHWLLRQSGHYDDVEHVEVNVIASEHMTESFYQRNRFQAVPYLEVIFDRCGAVPSGTTKVSDLAPWKDEAPCTTHTATGETIAEPDDRVFSLTEGGAVCMFFAEHFKLTNIWDPRRVLQRLRSVEISGHAELLARRMKSMVLIIVSSRTAGATTSDIVTGVAAHERELLWTFRIMEDMLTRNEEAAAHTAGLDYQELLAVGEREVSDIKAATESSQPSTRSTVDKQGPRDTRHHRYPTSSTLVALDAYIGGPSLSIADFLVTSDLQVYPYIQSWLPNSLKQPRFPALLRYLERMRNVHGFEDALLIRLSFLNVFRRRPKVMASNQLLYVFAERLKKMIDRGNGSDTTSSPSAEDAPMTGNGEADDTQREATKAPHQTVSTLMAKERLGRARAWAPKLTSHAPLLPGTLCEEDERALQASQSHRSRNTARLSTADEQPRRRTKKVAAFAAPPTAPPLSQLEVPDVIPAAPSHPAQPQTGCGVWRHDPYEHPMVPNTRVDGEFLPEAVSCRIPTTAALTQGRAHGTVMWRHDPYRAL